MYSIIGHLDKKKKDPFHHTLHRKQKKAAFISQTRRNMSTKNSQARNNKVRMGPLAHFEGNKDGKNYKEVTLS